jgi:hypothetical protein
LDFGGSTSGADQTSAAGGAECRHKSTMKKRKYNSYAELAAAFKSGELDEHYYLMLDKGAQENCLCYSNPALSDEENAKKSDEASAMWPGDPPIEGIFEAAGIRVEWC